VKHEKEPSNAELQSKQSLDNAAGSGEKENPPSAKEAPQDEQPMSSAIRAALSGFAGWARADWKRASLHKMEAKDIWQLFFLLMAVLVAAYTCQVFERQLNEMKTGSADTHTLALVAKQQADLVGNQIELSERPWVSAENISITQPLDFTHNPQLMVPDAARMTISYLLRNTGNSPAIHAMWRSKLIILSMARNETEEMIERENELCAPMLKMPRQLLDVTIFPGDKIPGSEGLGLYPKEIASGLKSRQSGIFKHKGYLSLALIACVDYRSSFSPQHHQTRYAFFLGVPEPWGGFMADIRPKGIRPDVKLVYFSQSAD
jgi:hypothetical protein